MFTASDVIYDDRHSILDPAQGAETVRCWLQHAALRNSITLLPSSLPPMPEESRCFLDLACATGDWLLDAAFAQPLADVIGIDPNASNVSYTWARARVGGLENVSCEVMDLRKPLPLSPASFDVITGRFLSAWLTEQEWLPMLEQCRLLLRPGGVLRLLEAPTGHCNSPACEQLSSWYFQALVQARVRSVPGTLHLPWLDLLKKAGYQHIAERREVLNFSAKSTHYEPMRQAILCFFELVRPFVLHSDVVTEETFAHTYWLMNMELYSNDFSGSWNLLDLQARPCED